jgi:hypothetical protein
MGVKGHQNKCLSQKGGGGLSGWIRTPFRRVVYHGVWMTAEYLKKTIYCSVVTQKPEVIPHWGVKKNLIEKLW